MGESSLSRREELCFVFVLVWIRSFPPWWTPNMTGSIQIFFQTKNEDTTASTSSNQKQGNAIENQSKHIRATKILPRNQLTLDGDHEWNQKKIDRNSDLSFYTAPRSSKHRPKGTGFKLHKLFSRVKFFLVFLMFTVLQM